MTAAATVLGIDPGVSETGWAVLRAEAAVTADFEALGTPTFGSSAGGPTVSKGNVYGPATYNRPFNIPPGTQVNDPEKLALGMQQVLRMDWAGTRTAIETIADQRIAAAL